jgi:hypothetical protein
MCEHERKDKTGGQKSPGRTRRTGQWDNTASIGQLGQESRDRTAEEDVKTAQPEQEREDRTQPEHDSID